MTNPCNTSRLLDWIFPTQRGEPQQHLLRPLRTEAISDAIYLGGSFKRKQILPPFQYLSPLGLDIFNKEANLGSTCCRLSGLSLCSESADAIWVEGILDAICGIRWRLRREESENRMRAASKKL